MGTGVARRRARGLRRLRSTSAACSRTWSATSSGCTRSRRSGRRPVPAGAARRGARGSAGGGAGAIRRTRATARSGCRTRATRRGSRRSSPTDRPDRPLLREADREQGRAGAVRGAAGTRRARRHRRLRRLPGDARGGGAAGTLFTGPLEHRHLAHLLPLCDVAAVPVDLPGGVRDGGRRGCIRRRAAGRRASTRASPRWPPGSGASIRRGSSTSPPSPRATPPRCGSASRRSSRSRRRSAASSAPPPAARVERNWSWARIAERLAESRLPAVGDEQKVGYEELLAQSRAAFEEVPDFTLAVEEEFALLDPATLGLVNRFEEVQAASKGTDVEPHLVGELIASEVEVRTGRCDAFADAVERIGERRAQLRALDGRARDRALRRRHPSVEPLAGAADHRHAALPAERRAAPLRRLAQQHVRAPRPRRRQRR